MIMEGLGAVVGFLSPRSKLVSEFSKGEEYILHLKKPLALNIIQNIPVSNQDSDDIQDSDDNQETDNNQETDTNQK